MFNHSSGCSDYFAINKTRKQMCHRLISGQKTPAQKKVGKIRIYGMCVHVTFNFADINMLAVSCLASHYKLIFNEIGSGCFE